MESMDVQESKIDSLEAFEELMELFDVTPKADDSVKDIFGEIAKQIALSKEKGALPKPLINEFPSSIERECVNLINNAVYTDFAQREELFKLRSDVTVSSFKYSKTKGLTEKQLDDFLEEDIKLNPFPSIVKLAEGDIYSACDDLLLMTKTCNLHAKDNRTKNYVMENGPKDRGGRMHAGHGGQKASFPNFKNK
uniref:Reverse transcriptase domain-containing protein n=1 Tax=Rhabditophanes sp. KR3021 TaxID=114890 RepID=A0AC35TZS0_9BILA